MELADFKVRDASASDAEAICAIYNAAIAERGSTFETKPHLPEDFADRIGADRYPLLVAEASGGVIGWAALAFYSGRPACYVLVVEQLLGPALSPGH